MFIGHYALAFGAKKASPMVSLGTLFLSFQLLDLVWPLLLLLGVEHVRIDPGNTAFTPLDFYDYPWSHGLFPVAAAAGVFGGLYYLLRKDGRGAAVLGAGVLSHWLLDYITHRPDLPLSPWSTAHVGLGLWNSVTATVLVEAVLLLGGLALYLKATTARDRRGRIAFWSLVAFLVMIWVLNILSPPPPSETAVAYGSLLLWLLVPWGYFIDRHRVPASRGLDSPPPSQPRLHGS
jgi:membrane-bound metal-dependent hydrolase YbcI (DUF457 family)